jgi:hypothetical protein
MMRFYKYIEGLEYTIYKGNVFVGVQFKDHEGRTVKSIKDHLYRDDSSKEF